MQSQRAAVSIFFRAIALIIQKDLRGERRSKESFSQMAIFAVVLLVIVNIATPVGQSIQGFLPGLIWIIFTFAGILGLNHSFAVEQENACLDGMRICPIPRSAIYLAKMIGNLLFMGFMELLLFPIMMILFNLSPGAYLFPLGLICGLGTLGFTGVGTLFAAMSVRTRVREVMLPLLVFPVMIPLLIAAINSTGKMLAQKPWGEIVFEVQFLVVFDMLFVGIAVLLFDFILESE